MGNKERVTKAAEAVLDNLDYPSPNYTAFAGNYVKDVGEGDGEFRFTVDYLSRDKLIRELDPIIHGTFGLTWAIRNAGGNRTELVVYESSLMGAVA